MLTSQVLTQVAVHEQPAGAVLNMPIDVCFRTTNLHGWPRIVLSVYGESGLQSLLQARPVPIPLGHGAALLPVMPGSQIPVAVPLYRPAASKTGPLAFVARLLRPLTGDYPDYFDSRFVGQGESRLVTRVEATGEATLHFNVATSGLAQAGFNVGGVAGAGAAAAAAATAAGGGGVFASPDLGLHGGTPAGFGATGGFNSTILGRSGVNMSAS
jgi:hypothetical protein